MLKKIPFKIVTINKESTIKSAMEGLNNIKYTFFTIEPDIIQKKVQTQMNCLFLKINGLVQN